jgi:hypothetical protein
MPLTPTTIWQLPRPALADPANIETAVGSLANRLETVLSTLHPKITTVTSVPTGVQANDKEVYYRFSTGGIQRQWHLKYSTTSGVWDVIAASAITVKYAVPLSLPATGGTDPTGMAKLSAAGAGPAVPLAGRYSCELWATLENTASVTLDADISLGTQTAAFTTWDSAGATMVAHTRHSYSLGGPDLALAADNVALWGSGVSTGVRVNSAVARIRPISINQT